MGERRTTCGQCGEALVIIREDRLRGRLVACLTEDCIGGINLRPQPVSK